MVPLLSPSARELVGKGTVPQLESLSVESKHFGGRSQLSLQEGDPKAVHSPKRAAVIPGRASDGSLRPAVGPERGKADLRCERLLS